MTAQERVIATAQAQVGYMGKKSNAQLDDFKANTPGLFNKFARDLDALGSFYNGRKNGYDWCDVFVDWCFVHTFGRETGQKLLCQPDRSCGAGTGYSLGYYRAKGRLYTAPQPGDQIFFGDSKSTWHTGLVVKVAGGYVYTVEGNAGSPSAVRTCRYGLGTKTIKGYGRPDWSLVPAQTVPVETPQDTPQEKPLEKPQNKPGTAPGETAKEDNPMKYYQTIHDVPAYYRDAVQKAVDQGALKGTGDGINVSEDLCRTLTVLDRLGVLG